MDFADRSSMKESRHDSAIVFDVLLSVSQTLRLRFNDWLARFELNDGRYAVLKLLANAAAGGCSQAELAGQLEQSESNISTLIERMQRDGLVDRLRSQADRRKRVLLISQAGRMTLAEVESHQAEWCSNSLKGLSVTDRSLLIGLLQKLGRGFAMSSDRVTTERATLLSSSQFDSSETAADHRNPFDDPRSPQFALQQMLLTLSLHAGTDTLEKDVA